MASRLAYEMDGALKKELLRFWSLRKLESFFDLPLTPGRGWASLLSLEPAPAASLAAVIRALVTSGALVKADGRYRMTAGPEAELPLSRVKGVEDLATLERLHLVHWRRDRTNLASEGDRIAPTSKLSELLEGAWDAVTYTTAAPPPGTPKPPPAGTEDFLLKVWESAWHTQPLPGGMDANALFDGGHLVPVLDPEGHPGMAAVWPPPEAAPPADLGFLAEEAPALFFHQVHSQLFPFKTRKRLDDDRKAGLFPLDDGALAPILKTYGKFTARKVRRPLYLQMARLIAGREVPLKAMLPRLVQAAGDTPLYTPRGLRRALAREVHLRGPLPMSLEDLLPHLKQLGLAVDTGTHIGLPLAFLRRVAGGRRQVPIGTGGSLLLDTDLSITLYRQALSPGRLHFLLSLGTATRAEHVWTVRLDSHRIPYHLWLGRTLSRSRLFFRREAPTYWNAVAEDHLESLYRQCEVMKAARRHVLWTHSRGALERLKGALEGEHIPAEIEPSAGERKPHQIIFRRKRDFLKAQVLLTRLRIPGL